MRILITGIDGFIGRNLTLYLIHQSRIDKRVKNLEIFGTYRNQNHLKKTQGLGKGVDLIDLQNQIQKKSAFNLKLFQIDLTQDYNWQFGQVDVIVHTAGIAHQNLKEQTNSEIYDQINHQATHTLVSKGINNGLKQFIFLSTTKVFELNHLNHYTIESNLLPKNAYGKSKLKAEQAIQSLFQNYPKQHFTIIRLPLVYGVGVRANFQSLYKMVQYFPILPTGSLDSQRSILGVFNLADLISTCLLNRNVFNQVLLAADSSLALNELIDKIAKSQNRRRSQIRIPKAVFLTLFKLLGKTHLIEALLQDSVLEPYYAGLKWQPPFSIEKNLAMITDSLDLKQNFHL